MPLTDNKEYTPADHSNIQFLQNEFENCTFNNFDLSNADFSSAKFIDCAFSNCNLSLVKLNDAIFRDTKFIGSKMLGLLFENCHRFGLSFSFDNCILNHSSFYKTKIRKTIFTACQLQDTDFTECDLANSVFNCCNFLNAKFENTIIENADFRTSYNYAINPEINRIKHARFSFPDVAGLLDKYNIKIE